MKSLVIEAASRVAFGLASRVREKEKASTLGLTIGAVSNHASCTISKSSAFGVRGDSNEYDILISQTLVSTTR